MARSLKVTALSPKIELSRTFIFETAVVIIYMTAWFLVALWRHRNDVADVAWGFGFLLVALTSMLLNGAAARPLLIAILVAAWGIRLSLYVYFRNRKKPEDFRYRKWREEWGSSFYIRSYLQVFILQSLLLVLISLPVMYVSSVPNPPLGYSDIIGVLLWAMGFVFETVGDYQLRCFTRDPMNKGRIMTSGLWRFTRHPNYFGEVVLWWGIFLIALSVRGGWRTIIGPMTITYLILKVSGIPMLEAKYRGNLQYEDYARRTSSFFPMPPRH
jgi:steroid 5-alpha reductase family enzyme